MRKDFFISYSRKDQRCAEWIAWQLEEAGYTVVINVWDFRPGGNFVLEMSKLVEGADRTIAVLSPEYLDNEFCHKNGNLLSPANDEDKA